MGTIESVPLGRVGGKANLELQNALSNLQSMAASKHTTDQKVALSLARVCQVKAANPLSGNLGLPPAPPGDPAYTFKIKLQSKGTKTDRTILKVWSWNIQAIGDGGVVEMLTVLAKREDISILILQEIRWSFSADYITMEGWRFILC